MKNEGTSARSDGADGTVNAIRVLTERIRRGDEQAFTEFYDSWNGRLYGFLLFLTGGHEQSAREVLQVTMIKAARKLPVFHRELDLWAWLSQVARNALVDLMRGQNAGSNLVELDPSLTASPEDPGEEILACLNHGLNELGDDERSLVEAIYFEHRPQEDVARSDGTTRKAIESKMARIRTKLKKYMLRKMRNEQ